MKKRTFTEWWISLIALPLLLGSCIKAIKEVATDTEKTTLSGTGKTMTTAAVAAPYRMLPVVLFNGGDEGGYHSFRIPSIIKAKDGVLLAFCEGRKNDPTDYGDIDVVCKRSTDNGITWSSLKVIAGQNAADTWGNPTAVYDPTKGADGRIWLFMSWNLGSFTDISQMNYWGARRVKITYSDDNGLSWVTPADATETLTPSYMKWDCIGPGIGIRTQFDHPGRLVIPAKDRTIYSDDKGSTWSYTLLPAGGSEGTIIEKMNQNEGGWYARIDRPGSSLQGNRAHIRSVGNLPGTWSSWAYINQLPSPGTGGCEGSLLRYNTDSPHRTLFIGPNSTDKRCDMTIWVSYNDGTTWPGHRSLIYYNTCDYANITAGRGGYSSMAKTADYCVAALTELNENLHVSTSNKSIELHKFNLPWILENNPE
ncbi:MAG TPA: sialidase family protein [Niabella sp.]